MCAEPLRCIFSCVTTTLLADGLCYSLHVCMKLSQKSATITATSRMCFRKLLADVCRKTRGNLYTSRGMYCTCIHISLLISISIPGWFTRSGNQPLNQSPVLDHYQYILCCLMSEGKLYPTINLYCIHMSGLVLALGFFWSVVPVPVEICSALFFHHSNQASGWRGCMVWVEWVSGWSRWSGWS